MSSKITLSYSTDAERREAMEYLKPIIGRIKGPYKRAGSKYHRVYIWLNPARKKTGDSDI